MRFLQSVAVTAVLGVFSASFVSAQEEPIRQHVETQAIEFVGNDTFGDGQLRTALAGQADFWIANHPLADPTELPTLVAEHLSRGYRDGGFRDVFIDVSHDAEERRLECHIREGTRFRCGDVVIRHPGSVDIVALRRRLTKPYPPKDSFPSTIESAGKMETRWVDESGKSKKLESPVWHRGDAVEFESVDQIRHRVLAALKDVGHFDADVTVSFLVDEEDATADLLVNVVDPGTLAVIESIQMDGLEANAKQPILDFLDVRADAVFSLDLKQSLHGKLWQSARFSDEKLSYDIESKTLTIDVTEIPGLPTIDQPLDEVAESLMKARAWMADCYRRGEDTQLLVEFNEQWFAMLTYSSAGAIVEVLRKEGDDATAVISLAADDKQLTLSHARHDKKIVLKTGIIGGQISMATSFGSAEEADRLFRFNINGNLSSERPDGEAPFVHKWAAKPSDWLRLTTKEGFRSSFEDGKLVVEDANSDSTRIMIDPETGKLQEAEGDVRLRVLPGLYEQARARTQAVTDKQADAFDGERPVTSLASYLMSEPMLETIHQATQVQFQNPSQGVALRKAIDNGLLAIPDAILTCMAVDDSVESFAIPSTDPAPGSFQQMMTEVVAKLVLRYAARVLPEEGWPIQVVREASLIAMGRADFSGKVMEGLRNNQEIGPVGHAWIAGLLDLAGQPSKQVFARRGLEVLTAESFHKDYETLVAISGRSVLGTTLASIQSLSAEEVQSLSDLVPDLRAKAFVAYVHSSKDNRGGGSAALFWLCQKPLEGFLDSMTR